MTGPICPLFYAFLPRRESTDLHDISTPMTPSYHDPSWILLLFQDE
jgi:hypothetical protein